MSKFKKGAYFGVFAGGAGIALAYILDLFFGVPECLAGLIGAVIIYVLIQWIAKGEK